MTAVQRPLTLSTYPSMRRSDITIHNSCARENSFFPQFSYALCHLVHRFYLLPPSEYNSNSTAIGNDTHIPNSVCSIPKWIEIQWSENNANAWKHSNLYWEDIWYSLLTLFVTWLDKLITCSRASFSCRFKCRISFAWRSSAELYSDEPPESNDAALPWAEIMEPERK